jgi:rhamnosyltransferase subunit B
MVIPSGIVTNPSSGERSLTALNGMARILLNTFGSLGDLHPFLALGIGLQRRGHQAVIATSAVYRQKIEGEGLEFAPVRPDIGDLVADKDLARLWHPRRGAEYLVRDYLAPRVEESYEDLLPACSRADLLITHLPAFAGPIVADKLKLRSISVALQPMLFMSKYDAPVLAPAPWLKPLYDGRPAVFHAIATLGVRSTNQWVRPLQKLRERIGVGRTKGSPLLDSYFSPYGTLALFSKHYAAPQADWPAKVWQTGFLFYDQLGKGMPSANGSPAEQAGDTGLRDFLQAGPAPVLFTLGSSEVMQPGAFYRESLLAAKKLGVRAVLLCGALDPAQLPQPIPDSILLVSYAPFSEIMPRASVIVHQGGIGTTAQALRSGRPSLVVPWAHDQPDNAERVQRLGVGRALRRSRYKAQTAARLIEELLKTPEYERKAASLAAKIRTEDGVVSACDAVEAALQ